MLEKVFNRRFKDYEVDIRINCNYFDYSKEIIEDITEALYRVLNKESEANEYNIKTKEGIYKKIEESLDKMSSKSDFVYRYNDFAIELKLFVHNETLNLVREIETVLLREDDLLIQSLYYKELFD